MEEKGLIVKKESFFGRIGNFFRNLFFGHKIEEQVVEKDTGEVLKASNDFDDRMAKVSKLLNIQKELDKKGINEDNLKELIKDLSFEEKVELKKLYIDQNESLKSEIKSYKNKIMAIKV